jgi:hypothetical protein
MRQEDADKRRILSEEFEVLPSGAKAHLHFCGIFGTTEVVPFQNSAAMGLSASLPSGPR